MVRAIALCLVLSGCSMFPETSQPVTIYKDREVVCNVNKPVPMTILYIDIETIQDADGWWWVSMGDQSYSNLALNNAEVYRYIEDLQVYANTLNACIAGTKKES